LALSSDQASFVPQGFSLLNVPVASIKHQGDEFAMNALLHSYHRIFMHHHKM
jgi:hypothetical protein